MKPFTTLAVLLLAIVAIAHLLRLIKGWEVVVAGTVIPQWVSIAALPITALLALMVWRESRRA